MSKGEDERLQQQVIEVLEIVNGRLGGSHNTATIKREVVPEAKVQLP